MSDSIFDATVARMQDNLNTYGRFGNSAFPFQVVHESNDHRKAIYSGIGMSLRDYFAGLALPKALHTQDTVEAAAKHAYATADAMLKARGL